MSRKKVQNGAPNVENDVKKVKNTKNAPGTATEQKSTAQSRPPKKEWHSPRHVARNIAYMLRFVVRFTPSYFLVTLGEAFGRGFEHILITLFTKYIFDALEREVEFTSLLPHIFAMAAYAIVFELFNKWRLEVYVKRVKLTLHEKIQNELYLKARALDQCCYDDPAFYNDFIWAIRESDARVAQIMENFSLFINRIVASAAILGIFATIDWRMAVALVVMAVLSLIYNHLANILYYRYNLANNPIKRERSYISRVFYLPDYAKELRQGGIAEYLADERLDDVTCREVELLRKYGPRMQLVAVISEVLYTMLPMVGFTLYSVVRYTADPTFSLGSVALSLTTWGRIHWMLTDLAGYISKFNDHSLYIDKVRRFMEYKPTIVGEVTDIPAFERLEVRGLSFRYPFSKVEQLTLSDIDITVSRGERIAFVGYNGAGKTTLIRLLLRLYDPTEGAVLYNGRDIRELEPEAYRRHIGAVFQDYKIFAATLAENVMGGDASEADRPTIEAALHAASFDDKLATLPQGLETQLTTEFSRDGVGLSGGEAQKVAISRVFARPFELIIMDEPSSALDPVAEYELNRSIMQSSADRTVIFISHRLSTTRMADRIYMFDGGRVVESGSHDELMAMDGKYAEMYRVQARRYGME